MLNWFKKNNILIEFGYHYHKRFAYKTESGLTMVSLPFSAGLVQIKPRGYTSDVDCRWLPLSKEMKEFYDSEN
jgi:hypothetical protein